MHRVSLLLILVFTSCICLAAERPPNVLFLFSDDQRTDTIAALGNSNIHTPNLDELVKRGTTILGAHCMGSYNGAVCTPSRAMLMTGRTLFNVEESLQNSHTWPESFGNAGYNTFACGKWHNSAPGLKRSFQNTKTIFMGGMSNPYTMNTTDDGKDDKSDKEHAVKRFSDTAISFIESQKNAAKPWLCYVAFNCPHDPRIAPKEFHEQYAGDKTPPLPKNFLPEHPFDNGEMKVRDEMLEAHPRTESAVRKHLADYYACITYLDSQVGRILEALKASGQAENTIIVYSSDHGLAIGSHGLLGKQSVYEHSMKAPLIVCGPGIAANKRVDAFVYLLDIFPTLGDLCGVKGPDTSEGISFAKILKGEATTGRPYLLTAYKDLMRGINDGSWKLITYDVKGEHRTQLFNLSNDPDELKDLSTDPQHANDLKRMQELLVKASAEFGDKKK